MSHPVEGYFARSYPRRDCGWGRLLFRAGESERVEWVRARMPVGDGQSVLDAGCGDGAFLQRVLRGRPSHIQVEDYVEAKVAEACARLRGCAEVVGGTVTDVATSPDSRRYDLVLALGVFDYAADWPSLLERLHARSKGGLLLDGPRRDTWHSLVRRGWLNLHRIRLHTADRRRMEALLRPYWTEGSELTQLSYHWIVWLKIKANAPTAANP